MPRTLVVLAVGGCSFHPASGSGIGSDSDDQMPDAGTMTVICHSSDSALRLCVDFEAQPPIDGSTEHLALSSEHVTAINRLTFGITERAVQVDVMSSLRVAESNALDINGDFTLELWIDPAQLPAAGTKYWMFDNNTQYGMELDADGRIRCLVSTTALEGTTRVAPGSWTHVACALAGKRLAAYVGGAVDACHSANPPVTTGDNGSAIGANVSASQRLSEQFVGGLDNLRVYARALSSAEICTLATDGTGCHKDCPK
jgi:hypothetical protein